MIKLIETSKTGIEAYSLTNEVGMEAVIITYGAIIHKLIVPSKQGKIDIVAGFNDIEGYRQDNPHFNAIIGRVANRIGGAKFTLNGKEYSLYKNDGNNHLHGGLEGFDRKIWTAKIDGEKLVLTYISKDGEENYPGTLVATVKYYLDEDGLNIEYFATSDQDTLCQLTNHAYFNLDGDFKTILNHKVFINSDKLTVVDSELIPHGDYLIVDNTPHDFRKIKTIGKDLSTPDELIKIGIGGYDFNFVLNNDKKSPVAIVEAEHSGIKMSVYTDLPCMQFYTGNFLDGLKGKCVYNYQSAFCMETQGYPNACNVPSFDSMELKAGDKYYTHTKYQFEW